MGRLTGRLTAADRGVGGAAGMLPRLSFSDRELVLPPVPLGVTSSATAYVESDGYDNLEARPALSAAASCHQPLSAAPPAAPDTLAARGPPA